MTEGRDWQARVAAAIGANVRMIREGQSPKMSAQALADATERLGHPIQRPVLTNLENGRRASVTVAELFTLARALGVPPVALIAPLVDGEPVEVLPGEMVPAWDGAGWFDGDLLPPESAPAEGTVAAAILDAYDLRFRYQIAQIQLNDATRRAGQLQGAAREDAIENLAVYVDRVDSLREAMVRQGVRGVPPVTNPAALLREGRIWE